MRLFLEDGSPAPTQPVAGQEFMALTKGDVVDVVLQNLAANANGDFPLCSLVYLTQIVHSRAAPGSCMQAENACRQAHAAPQGAWCWCRVLRGVVT